jgi:hypothetical protein
MLCETKESFSFIAAQVLSSLQAGQSKIIEWDQRGLDGTQVKEGEYRVSVKTIPDQSEGISCCSLLLSSPWWNDK